MASMAGEKFVFIIPGYRHRPTNKGYREIRKLLKKEGFLPIPVAIPWKESTISENTEFFMEKLNKIIKKRQIRPNQTYFLGFSFGALIAFLAATKMSIQGLILCSLSPYFREDLSKNKPTKLSFLQEKRWKDFSGFRNSSLSQKIKAKKICMLYGTKESRSLIKRVTATFKKMPTQNKYLFPIRNTHHDIADKKYLYVLHSVAREIL